MTLVTLACVSIHCSVFLFCLRFFSFYFSCFFLAKTKEKRSTKKRKKTKPWTLQVALRPSGVFLVYNSSLKIRLRRSKCTQAVSFCVSWHFFAMRTAKLDGQGDVFATVKKTFLFLQCFESVHYRCNFYTGIAIFTLLEQICFAVQKLQCLGDVRPHLGAVNFFTLKLPNEAAQNRTDVLGCASPSHPAPMLSLFL